LGRQVRHADADVEARRERPRGHLASALDGIALAWDAGSGDDEGRKLLGRLVLADGSYRFGADEARVLLATPSEPGLDRAARLHQVVAVEVEADLQAQRVARAQPG